MLFERILKSIIRKLTPSQKEEYQSRSEYMSANQFISYLGHPFMHISVYKLTLIERAGIIG